MNNPVQVAIVLWAASGLPMKKLQAQNPSAATPNAIMTLFTSFPNFFTVDVSDLAQTESDKIKFITIN